MNTHGLFANLPLLLETLPKRPPSPPITEADHQETLNILRLAGLRERQRRNIGDLRLDLTDILGDRLQREIDEAVPGPKLSEKTKRDYKSDLDAFRAYTEQHGYPFLPTNGEVIAGFLIETFGTAARLRPARARRAIFAIKLRHGLADAPDPCGSPYVKAALGWIEDEAAKSKDAEPAKPADKTNKH